MIPMKPKFTMMAIQFGLRPLLDFFEVGVGYLLLGSER